MHTLGGQTLGFVPRVGTSQFQNGRQEAFLASVKSLGRPSRSSKSGAWGLRVTARPGLLPALVSAIPTAAGDRLLPIVSESSSNALGDTAVGAEAEGLRLKDQCCEVTGVASTVASPVRLIPVWRYDFYNHQVKVSLSVHEASVPSGEESPSSHAHTQLVRKISVCREVELVHR